MTLPFRHQSLKTTNFALLQLSQSGTYIDHHFSRASLIKNERNKFGVNTIEIKGLEEGKYRVWLKKEDLTIEIQVVEGKYWQGDREFVLQERAKAMTQRIETRQDCLRIDSLTFNNVEVENDDQGKKTIQQV